MELAPLSPKAFIGIALLALVCGFLLLVIVDFILDLLATRRKNLLVREKKSPITVDAIKVLEENGHKQFFDELNKKIFNIGEELKEIREQLYHVNKKAATAETLAHSAKMDHRHPKEMHIKHEFVKKRSLSVDDKVVRVMKNKMAKLSR